MRSALCNLPPLLLVLSACGLEGSDPLNEDTESPLAKLSDATGIHRLVWNGVDLVEGVGGYYIIGSCTGADDANNVISLGSDGRTLSSPGNCPGAPFSMSITGDNPIHVAIQIGPLPVDYRGLSVPFDPTMAYFEEFRFSGSRYKVGCANSWSDRSGSGGRFSSIPQPCVIPGHGAVGVARVIGPGPGSFGEISGPVATVRRTILSSNVRELVFIRHPYTHNIELTFGTEPISQNVLPRGSTFFLEEEIWVSDPVAPPAASAPPTGAQSTSQSDLLLAALYRATLFREPDPSGRASFVPMIDQGGFGGLKIVAREIVASQEFAGVRATKTSDQILNQLYVGLLGRNVDPSGRISYLGLVQGGRYVDVLDILIDSQELRSRFPGVPDGPSPSPSAPSPSPQTAPPSTGSAGTGGDLLAPIYRALLWREPDPSGIASYGDRASSRGIDELKGVAHEILGSEEFQHVRATRTSEQILNQLYVGLLGRSVDPSGRSSYLGSIQAGGHAEVVDTLIDSPEFRTRHRVF